MATRTDALRTEARATSDCLAEAAKKLLEWAAIQALDPGSLVTGQEIREVAQTLAKQGGRLDMALEMSR
jgi:hypothetical protein